MTDPFLICVDQWAGVWESRPTRPSCSVSMWELSVRGRTRNLLFRQGIRTVGELVEQSAADLCELRNFGETSLYDVRDALRQFGLRLKGD